MAKQFRHDRHTVSLLTDYMVFSPKYSVSFIAKRLIEAAGCQDRSFLSLKNGVKAVFGLQVAIMEVLDMAGKSLRNILPDKTRNRKVEIYYTGLGLKSGV